VTGYYEPVLAARRSRSQEFSVPLYGLPEDLVSVDLAEFGRGSGRLVGRLRDGDLVPYPDRAAIDFGGALDGVAPVLGFVRDPVDAFFLHVEGSGILELDGGRRVRLAYAGANGHAYRSIGRYLRETGLLPPEQLSLDGIRSFLHHHPERLEEVLGHNPSYVFFRQVEAEGGPPGCFGMPLVPHRSVALDRSLFPVPVLAHLEVVLPAAGGGEERISRFVVMLDTGSAIRGHGRVDLYFGTGEDAGARAGRTRSRGRLLILVPTGEAGSSQR
jgi:membrane-bound lytic murein transglycosylase A